MIEVLAQTFLTVWAVVYRPNTVCGVVDCIQSRRPCIIDLSCSSLLQSIPKLCGPTDNEHCYSTAPECRETLLKLKSTQDFQKSCVCPDPSSRSCQDFQNLVYNHPCLYQQRIHPAFFPQPANAFNFDLEFANQLLLQKHVVLSCPSALHACRKSPLCRRVYDEFRRRCKIKDGRCRMTNAALCYNSYELIKLTPLWKCICDRPSEKRCVRIQNSIIGNICVVGSFPWLSAEEPEDMPHRNTTRPPMSVIHRTTKRPKKITRPRPLKITTTQPTDLDQEQEVDEVEDLPNGSAFEEENTEALSSSANGAKQQRDPDETYVFFPRFALLLIQPLIETVRNLLAENLLMTTLPPSPTTTTIDPEGMVTEGLVAGSQSEIQAASESSTSAMGSIRIRLTGTGRDRLGTTQVNGTSQRKVTTPGAVTGAPTAIRPINIGSSSFSVTETTKKTALLYSTKITETAALSDYSEEDNGFSPTTEPMESYEGDTESASSTHFIAEVAEQVEVPTPDPRGVEPGMCITQIEKWRIHSEFDRAVVQFHNSCRWHTEANETCDALDCLDAEVRVKRWMGDLFDFCRNLTCENEHCTDMIDFLTPGCLNAVSFLEDMGTDKVACRDLRKNLVLKVDRGGYQRLFTSDSCSQMCTCGQNGRVVCVNLPCTQSGDCQGEYAVFPSGWPAYRAFQGECLCYTSKLLCMRPYNYTITKGAWLFMAYSSDEEIMLFNHTNLTIAANLHDRVRRLPYPNHRTEPCLFHQEPTEADYIVLKSDEFEFDNTTAETGSPGTRINDEFCNKFFNWIVNEVTEKKSMRQDLLLSLVKLAESEWDKRPSAGASVLTVSALCMVLAAVHVGALLAFPPKRSVILWSCL